MGNDDENDIAIILSATVLAIFAMVDMHRQNASERSPSMLPKQATAPLVQPSAP